MADGIQSRADGADLEMDVQSIDIDLIDLDPENPNVVDEQLLETLSAEIERGFVQPILVAPMPNGRYAMVDGEHRLRLIAEKGYRSIPAVVEQFADGQAGEDERRIRLLTMNRLRGSFVPIRLAYLLKDLAQRIPEQDLRRRLGMDAGEMRDSLRLADFSDVISERLREGIDAEDRRAPHVLTFVVTRDRDAEAIERVVGSVVTEKVDRGAALAKIVRDYEKAQRAK